MRDSSRDVPNESSMCFSTIQDVFVKLTLKELKEAYLVDHPSSGKKSSSNYSHKVAPYNGRTTAAASTGQVHHITPPIICPSVEAFGATGYTPPVKNENFVQGQPSRLVDIPERECLNLNEDDVSARSRRTADEISGAATLKRIKLTDDYTQQYMVVTRRSKHSPPYAACPRDITSPKPL